MGSDAGDAKENDFPDTVLKYINQILMKEDLEEETCTFQNSALQAAEKSFHDILSVNRPSSSSIPSSSSLWEENRIYNCNHCFNCTETGFVKSSLISDLGGREPRAPVEYTFQFNLQSSRRCCQPSSLSNVVKGQVDCPVDTPLVSNYFGESKTGLQFKDGTEDEQTFLPQLNHVIFNFQNNRIIPVKLNGENSAVASEAERAKRDHLPCKLREGEYPDQLENELEKRSNKHLKIYSDEPEKPELFDKMMLPISGDDEFARFTTDETLQRKPIRTLHQYRLSRISNCGTNCRKKLVKNRMIVDLRTLLIRCAEAVADNDYKSANEQLMQIKQYSSPFGDGSQRLAHCFVKALEARLSGTGSEVYAALAAKRVDATYMLKACRFYITACPFMKMSNFFATQTIMKLAEKASRLHIIHFGIMYGFQWPCLIQCLATRHGGPPVLRITGIDLPQPDFHPAARVEETGRYLARYCERFGVPFEYNAIAQNWENIQVEDLKIDRDELTVVNCLYMMRYLLDETVAPNSPRDAVLNLIKRTNPDVFIHGIINGAYDAPFFISRFKEALFYFSAVFDMFDANASRESWERMMFEEEIYAREIMNVIACEGIKRIERPETYKQWQFQNLRAGFRQFPLNQEIMNKVKSQVKLHYHKDFLVDEDSQWMLQGWRGRILFAISCWKST